MQKILIPVDASGNARRAVEYAATVARQSPGMEVVLLNVREELEPRVHAMLKHDQIQAVQGEEAALVLEPLQKILADAGVPYSAAWRSGPVAQTIDAYCNEIGCTGILMGTRGMSAIGNLVLGSTATKVIHVANVPVTLVK